MTTLFDKFVMRAVPSVATVWAAAISPPALETWWAEGDHDRVLGVLGRGQSSESLVRFALVDPVPARVRATAQRVFAAKFFADEGPVIALAARVPDLASTVLRVFARSNPRRRILSAILNGQFDPGADFDTELTPLEIVLGTLRSNPPDRDARIATELARESTLAERFALLAALRDADALDLVPAADAISAAIVAMLAGDRATAEVQLARASEPSGAALLSWALVAPGPLAPAHAEVVRRCAAEYPTSYEDGIISDEELAAARWAAACVDRAIDGGAALLALRRAELAAATAAAATFAAAIVDPPADDDVAAPTSYRKRIAAKALDAFAGSQTAGTMRGVLRALTALGAGRHHAYATEVMAQVEAIVGPLDVAAGPDTEMYDSYHLPLALAAVPGRADEGADLLDDESVLGPVVVSRMARALLRDGDAERAREIAERGLGSHDWVQYVPGDLACLAAVCVEDADERARAKALLDTALAALPLDPAWVLDGTVTAAPSRVARSAALEATLAAGDPQDAAYDGTLAVYADYLTERGDPRGELIALARANHAAEAALWIERHASHFYGELARYTRPLDGTDERVFTWRDGFLERARFGIDHQTAGDDRSVERAVQLLLAHPSGALLRELVLAFAVGVDGWILAPAIAALARADQPALRTLVLGEFQYNGAARESEGQLGPDYEISWAIVPPLQALWSRVPNLRDLVILGNLKDDVLGDLSPLAKLERLAIRSGGIARENIRAIVAAPLPALVELELWFGHEDYGFTGDVSDLAPLFAGDHLPELVHLSLMNCPYADDLVEPLARSPLLARLATLSFALGTLTDVGVAAMRRHAEAFSHLELLDLEDNVIVDLDACDGLAQEVLTDTTKVPADEYRWYVSVGE